MTTATSLASALEISEQADNPRVTIALTTQQVADLTRWLVTRLRTERGSTIANRQVLTHLIGVFRDGKPTVRRTFKLTDTLVGYLADTVLWYGGDEAFAHELSATRW